MGAHARIMPEAADIGETQVGECLALKCLMTYEGGKSSDGSAIRKRNPLGAVVSGCQIKYSTTPAYKSRRERHSTYQGASPCISCWQGEAWRRRRQTLRLVSARYGLFGVLQTSAQNHVRPHIDNAPFSSPRCHLASHHPNVEGPREAAARMICGRTSKRSPWTPAPWCVCSRDGKTNTVESFHPSVRPVRPIFFALVQYYLSSCLLSILPLNPPPLQPTHTRGPPPGARIPASRP